MSTQYIALERHYSAGFVVLAYVVAVVGSWSTVELLLKRTGNSGIWNASLLVGAGIAFGTTATWGMHFIGNQALTLRQPGTTTGGVQLSYGVGFTLLSLVVAVLAMILAFSFIGLRFDGARRKHEREVELEKFDPEGQFDLEPTPPALSLEQTPTDHKTESDSKRFSWNGAKAQQSVISLPLPGKRSRPDSMDSTKKRAMDDGDSFDSENDGGEFGVNPAGLSGWAIAKILGAGIICGGGVAGMRECRPAPLG